MMLLLKLAALFGLLNYPTVGQSHYSVRWDKSYGKARYFCRPETSVVANNGDLWVICRGHDYEAKQHATTLYRIDGASGELKFARELRTELPAGPAGRWDAFYQLAAIGEAVAVLTSTTSGGQTQIFEGVFFTSLDSEGLPENSRLVVPKGAQIQEVRLASDGNLIVTADQSPLSVQKVDSRGRVLWRKILSSKLDLPTLAGFPDGSMCLAAQLSTSTLERPAIQLMKLNSQGQVMRQVSISAAHAAVAAAPGGNCAVLYTPGFGSRVRRLARFDPALKRQWDVLAPFEGKSGRTFTLDSIAGGFLATEHAIDDQHDSVVTRFGEGGQVVWQDVLPKGFEMLSFGSGATYVVTGHDSSNKASFRALKVHFDAN